MQRCGWYPNAKIFQLSRPVLWVNTLGPAWVGLWLTGTLWDNRFFPILLWCTLPFNLLIYGVNDISDMDTDCANDRKGGWEGARVCPDEIRPILFWVTVLNSPFLIFFTIQYNFTTLMVLFLYALVFLLYSLPPRFKARRFFDSLSNAAYALPLVFVPVALNAQVVWPAATGLMTWSIAKHCYDSIQDIDVDRSAGLDTTAIALGKSGALVFCSVFWLFSSFAFARLSLTLAIANALYASFLVLGMAFFSDRHAQRRLYRYSVAFPYVVGTYGGVALAWTVFSGKWMWP